MVLEIALQATKRNFENGLDASWKNCKQIRWERGL
jgi:hypothetical protein